MWVIPSNIVYPINQKEKRLGASTRKQQETRVAGKEEHKEATEQDDWTALVGQQHSSNLATENHEGCRTKNEPYKEKSEPHQLITYKNKCVIR